MQPILERYSDTFSSSLTMDSIYEYHLRIYLYLMIAFLILILLDHCNYSYPIRKLKTSGTNFCNDPILFTTENKFDT